MASDIPESRSGDEGSGQGLADLRGADLAFKTKHQSQYKVLPYALLYLPTARPVLGVSCLYREPQLGRV